MFSLFRLCRRERCIQWIWTPERLSRDVSPGCRAPACDIKCAGVYPRKPGFASKIRLNSAPEMTGLGSGVLDLEAANGLDRLADFRA